MTLTLFSYKQHDVESIRGNMGIDRGTQIAKSIVARWWTTYIFASNSISVREKLFAIGIHYQLFLTQTLTTCRTTSQRPGSIEALKRVCQWLRAIHPNRYITKHVILSDSNMANMLSICYVFRNSRVAQQRSSFLTRKCRCPPARSPANRPDLLD